MPKRSSAVRLVDLDTALVLGGSVIFGALLLRGRGSAQAHAPARNPRSRPIATSRPPLRVVQGGRTPAKPKRELDSFGELLALSVTPKPAGGFLYAIREGDTPETIARAVLGAEGTFTEQHVLDYVHLFSSSRFNLDRYGSRSTSKAYPKRWMVPYFGQGLRAAFLPRNADGLAALREQRLPKRTVDPDTGAPTDQGEHLGLLWLPPVSGVALREEGLVTCAHRNWADGTATLEPNPDLLRRLEVAA